MVPERAAVMQAMLRGPQTTVGRASGCHAPKHASTHASVATTAAASRREMLSLALLTSTCVAKRAVASDSPAPSSCAGGTETQLARGGAAYDAFADSYDDLNAGAVADAFGACCAVSLFVMRAGRHAHTVACATTPPVRFARAAPGAPRTRQGRRPGNRGGHGHQTGAVPLRRQRGALADW